MRVLVEHGTSRMDNLGDIALLKVTVDRVRELFPSASISVITRSRPRLKEHIPGVLAIAIDYPPIWLKLRSLVRRRGAAGTSSFLARTEAQLSQRLPAGFRRSLFRAVQESDLVVHAGSGILADPFVPAALRRLGLFEQAIRLGKPTALLSQGVGPLQSSLLRHAMTRVLPEVDLLSVRDHLSARILSDDLGIGRTAIPVTGDDTLELAIQKRPERSGSDIGINLRLAPYSNFEVRELNSLVPMIKRLSHVAHATGGAVVPLVIDRSDYAVQRALVKSWPELDLGQPNGHSIGALMAAISGCRLVVTASFHGAVLALGQGIPAICLHKTAYYWRKFAGLAEMFPDGCSLLDLSTPLNSHTFARNVDGLLGAADVLQPALLDAAREAVRASKDIARRLPEIAQTRSWEI